MKHLVGRVANQRMLERQLGLAGERVAVACDDYVLLAQHAQRLLQIAALGLDDRRQRALPEGPPDDRGVRQQPLLKWLQRVQPRGQQRLHGRRQLGGVGAFVFRQASHHLLGEQRIALGARRDRVDRALVDAIAAQQRRDQLARICLAERFQEQRRRIAAHAAPSGSALQQLFPAQTDLQHGRTRPLHEMLDQVQHPLICPVDVLPHEHQRLLARQAFDARAHGGEEDFARELSVLRFERRRLVGRLDTQQSPDQCDLRQR
jgi:hypothetical protein